MFHCLPGAGGLYDQDSFIAYGMSMVVRARAEKQAMEEARKHRHRR
jgi:hypothetical protein